MRADRLLSMMLLLQAKGKLTADELSEALGVSVRTIYRDIDALSVAGVPIYTQSGTGGGCYLDEGYRISLTGLTRPQIRSLFASGGAGPLQDLGLADAVEDTLLKLLAALPPMHRHEAEQMRQRIHFDPSGWYFSHEPTPELDQMYQAVWESRQIAVTYRKSDGTVTETMLDPYGLVAKASIWYLVAAKPDGVVRTYRLVRFDRIDLQPTTFDRPATFDLKAYWDQSISAFQSRWPNYPVTLRVHHEYVHVFEQVMPDRFEVMEHIDATWIRFNVLFGSIEEARAFVLGMREAVIVEEPRELHDTVIEWARKILEFHGELTA